MSQLPRNFYELAAEIAHQGVERIQRKKTKTCEDFLLKSSILEPDYHDCLFAFVSKGQRLANNAVHSMTVAKALNKFCKNKTTPDIDGLLEINAEDLARSLAQLYSDASELLDWPKQSVLFNADLFSPEEIMGLMLWVCRFEFSQIFKKPANALSALAFHNELSKLANAQDCHPFFFMREGESSNEISLLIDKASLFSANRLRKKSLQKNNGAEALIRYYHAALTSSSQPESQIDILYWLKFDENHQIMAGDFIHENSKTDSNTKITMITPYVRLLDAKAGKLPLATVIKEVIGLYIDGLVEPKGKASED